MCAMTELQIRIREVLPSNRSLRPDFLTENYCASLQILRVNSRNKFLLIASFVFWDIVPCNPLKLKSQPTFRENISPQSLGTKYKQCFLADSFSFLLGSYETSVDFQRTTLCYFREDRTLHNRRCENFKTYIF
jgi:hypothetical protein